MLTPAWTVTCYARLQDFDAETVASVFSVVFVVFRVTRPSKNTIELLFRLYVKNAELLFSEQEFTPFDSDVL